jgi:hypothetical protein
MFNQILSIHGLGDENAFSSLFDLKTNKIVQLIMLISNSCFISSENSWARESRVAPKIMSSI